MVELSADWKVEKKVVLWEMKKVVLWVAWLVENSAVKMVGPREPQSEMQLVPQMVAN
jgi:hypothetical protein